MTLRMAYAMAGLAKFLGVSSSSELFYGPIWRPRAPLMPDNHRDRLLPRSRIQPISIDQCRGNEIWNTKRLTNREDPQPA